MLFELIERKCQPLCKMSGPLLCGFTLLLLIGHFAALGGFIDAALYYLFFLMIIVGVSAQDYVSLLVLFVGKCILYGIDAFLLFTNYYTELNDSNLWKIIFGICVNGILAYVCAKFAMNKDKGEVIFDR